jgi:putative restriction endonuclease
MSSPDIDTKVRLRAFAFLEKKCRLHPLGILSRSLLEAGFEFEGRRVPLVGPQGIFKPAILPEIPLSITTAPVVEGRPRPYDDHLDQEGLIRYRYRGRDPDHHENVGLRKAMLQRKPLIYFYGVVTGRYLAAWPAYIVHDDPRSLSVDVEIGRLTAEGAAAGIFPGEDESAPERRYITVAVQQRLHQQGFRYRVLQAYRECCSVCRLRHLELLDAAHILPDVHPRGEPSVSNGLALCKLHHAAFDANILGVRPDLVVEIRKDILEESDGPLLIHGLKECHNRRLAEVPFSPRLRPRREYLEERYALFRKAS